VQESSNEPLSPGVLHSLDALSWQRTVFADILRRQALRRLEPTWPCRDVRLHVVRNQPFEFVEKALGAFLSFAGIQARITFSSYDDSLAQPTAGMPGGVDAVIVWLRFDHYGELSPEELVDWLADRVAAVRVETAVPILVANWASAEHSLQFNARLSERLASEPGVRICDLCGISQRLGDAYEDLRMEQVSGSPLSDQATLEVARMFGLVWLPAVLLPPLKAVVCDLDNTLWAGILTEDGPEGIVVSEEHQQLQRSLLGLRDRGVFLALASKNDRPTVDQLFASRGDLLVSLADFSSIKIGWVSKAESVAAIADDLRIGADALLFVDDNPGELAEVAISVPGVHLLLAGDPAETERCLRYYPGLDPWATSPVAAQRISDLAAARCRQEHLAVTRFGATGDAAAYLAQLGTELRVGVDIQAAVARLADLSGRVNQFNTAFRRLGEAEVAAYLADDAACAVAVDLRDRFSDSGIVAGAFARRGVGGELVVDEIVVSCRALGRDLEMVILAVLLRGAHECLGGDQVRIEFVTGPRNAPALTSLEALVGRPVDDGTAVEWAWSEERVAALLASFPVEVLAL
jgi:FkbH-like protein